MKSVNSIQVVSEKYSGNLKIAPMEHELMNCMFTRKHFALLNLKHIFKSGVLQLRHHSPTPTNLYLQLVNCSPALKLMVSPPCSSNLKIALKHYILYCVLGCPQNQRLDVCKTDIQGQLQATASMQAYW